MGGFVILFGVWIWHGAAPDKLLVRIQADGLSVTESAAMLVLFVPYLLSTLPQAHVLKSRAASLSDFCTGFTTLRLPISEGLKLFLHAAFKSKKP